MPDGAQFEEVIRVKFLVDSTEIETAEARAKRLMAEAKAPVAPRSPIGPRMPGARVSSQSAGQDFAQSAVSGIERGLQSMMMGRGRIFRRMVAPMLMKSVGGFVSPADADIDSPTARRTSYPSQLVRPLQGNRFNAPGGNGSPPGAGPSPSPTSPGGSGVTPPPNTPITPPVPTPPNLPGGTNWAGVGSAIGITSVVAGAALWAKSISATVETFKKAAGKMADAAEHVASGATHANATEMIRGVLEGRVAGAYAMQGRLMLQYGLRGASVGMGAGIVGGGIVGGAMGGPAGAAAGVGPGAVLGSGVGAALGTGYGYLKGLPDVLSARLQSFLMTKLAGILDSLVDQSKKYNAVAAQWAARYEVAQIQFTMKMAKATEPVIAAWMQLKLKILEVVGNALPKLKPLFDFIASKLDDMKGSMNRLPEQILGTAANFLELTATTMDLIESFKHLIAWVEEKVTTVGKVATMVMSPGQAASVAVQGSGVLASLLSPKRVVGVASAVGRSLLGLAPTTNNTPISSTTPPTAPTTKPSTPPGANQPSPSLFGITSPLSASIREFAAKIRQQQEEARLRADAEDKVGGKSTSASPFDNIKNILTMQDFKDFNKLHRESFKKLQKGLAAGDEAAVQKLLLLPDWKSTPDAIARRQAAAREAIKAPKLQPMPGLGSGRQTDGTTHMADTGSGSYSNVGAFPSRATVTGTFGSADKSAGTLTEQNNLLVAKNMLANLAKYGTINPHPLSELNAIAKGNQMVGRSNKIVQELYDYEKAKLYPTGTGSPATEPTSQKAPAWMSYADWAAKRGLKPSAAATTKPVAPPTPTPKVPSRYDAGKLRDGIKEDISRGVENYFTISKKHIGFGGTVLDQLGADNLRDAEERDAQYRRQQRDRLARMGVGQGTQPTPGKPSPAEPKPTPKKPPTPSAETTAKQPRGTPFPSAQIANENKFEIRLQNDRMMHESIMQVRDHLMEGSRKMQNEVRLQAAMLDGMTLGALL